MKKVISSFISFALLAFPLTIVDAHSGRTDSSGGHNCSEKSIRKGLCSGYHYHNGGYTDSGSTGSTTYQDHSSAPERQAPIPQTVTIIAVEKAMVYSSPIQDTSYLDGYLEYGAQIFDQGGTTSWQTVEFTDYSVGYVPNTVITKYYPMKPKTVTVGVEKGYVFNISSVKGKVRAFFTKNRPVSAIGQNGNWYFISTTDYQGRPLKGFIAKTIAR